MRPVVRQFHLGQHKTPDCMRRDSSVRVTKQNSRLHKVFEEYCLLAAIAMVTGITEGIGAHYSLRDDGHQLG